jgi:acyl carrier protein
VSIVSNVMPCDVGIREQQAKIRAVLARQFNVDAASIVEQANILEDFYVDSLDLLDMCLALNDAFDIEISPQDLQTIETVGDVYRVVAQLQRDAEHETKVPLGVTEEIFVSRLAAVRTVE